MIAAAIILASMPMFRYLSDHRIKVWIGTHLRRCSGAHHRIFVCITESDYLVGTGSLSALVLIASVVIILVDDGQPA